MSTTAAFLPVLARDEEGQLLRVPGPPRPDVPRVWWTPEADSDLLSVVDPAVREELKCHAEVTLHEIEITADDDRRAEGFEGEVMWHWAWTHEQELLAQEDDDGPWTYVLFYRRAVGSAEFEVLALRSYIQVADRIWEQVRNGN